MTAIYDDQTTSDHEEPPPSYPSDPSSSSNPATFKAKPTNFLLLSTEKTPIHGEYVINPSIRLPSYLLPPLGDNEERKNLSLTSIESSVNANIWLLPTSPSSGGQRPRRTTISLVSEHGSIFAQLRTLEGAAPCLVTCRAPHGTVRLALPRAFHGLLSLSTRPGRIMLSDTLAQNSTQLSQITTAQWYFIGEFKTLGEGTWEGDQVEIEAPQGGIQLSYADEEPKGINGFFSRLFGTN